MTLAYEKHKAYIMKWRNNNKEKYNEYCNEKFQEYYLRNKETIKIKMAAQYLRNKEKIQQKNLYKKEAAIFRNILL